MSAYMIVLRLIHIFSGVFWAGTIFFLVSFVQPSVVATGPEGQKFMQHLGLKTRLTFTMLAVASLTALSGLLMYERLLGFRVSALDANYGRWLAIGGLAGIAAWIVGYAFTYRSLSRMKVISGQIQAAGAPPDQDQLAQMGALAARVTQGSRITAVLLAIALIGMSIAQYSG